MVSIVLLYSDDFKIYISVHTELQIYIFSWLQIYIFNCLIYFFLWMFSRLLKSNMYKSTDHLHCVFPHTPVPPSQNGITTSNQDSRNHGVAFRLLYPSPTHPINQTFFWPHLLMYLSKHSIYVNPNWHPPSPSHHNHWVTGISLVFMLSILFYCNLFSNITARASFPKIKSHHTILLLNTFQRIPLSLE